MGNDGVQSVERALALLDCFRPGAESISLAALAQASGMHKTTVYRLMNSLERLNYVIRSDAGAYSLGPRMLYLGKLYEQSFHLSTLVEPILRRLALSTNASASYCVIEELQRVILFRAEPAEGLRHTRLPGTTFPLDDTATGRTLRFWALGERVFDAPPQLPLFSSGKHDPHMAACSTPVFGPEDKCVAALTLSGPVSRLESARTSPEFTFVQLQAASDLSRKLGASIGICERTYGRT